MQDKDAANLMPDEGNIRMLNEASSHNAHVFTSSKHIQPEKAETQRNILIVEDDASLAHLEANILTAHGYSVVIASSGELAVTAIELFIPDLLVLDLELPGSLSGWDVFLVLRRHANSIPVLLTTSSETPLRQRVRTSGETRLTLDHLPKPYLMQTFLKRVERMLMIAPR